MAKARIFLSSTCYDLSRERTELHNYLSELGFEVLNSERGDFGVTPGLHSHTACIDQVKESDYVLLIIGGQRGGTYIGSESSITNEEFNEARRQGIPVIGCVDRSVYDTLRLYKKNPNSDFSSIVNDKRVFHFIEYINAGATDNWLHRFDNIQDIRNVIKGQLSHYLSLYSKGLRSSNHSSRKTRSSAQVVAFPSVLKDFPDADQDVQTSMKNGLLDLHKTLASILRSELKRDYKLEQLKTLWVVSRYGQLNSWGLSLKNDIFKGNAWSTYRGERVFNQMSVFGIRGKYEENDDGLEVHISFPNESEDNPIAPVLKQFVDDLAAKHGSNDGLQLFQQADMRIYAA